eukprot:CAMPEP_0119347960 /NCGR_PEP_ID=MMETSP1333-20130426/108795_1 /TAXON_ID=418940 /ORGANISM="Scyphosphaera apsteinii, Strain RCC1455" /LENGTH=74 /DNA_ID=CAMNT_0007360523 /DNA_START=413 /DNA_END=637 /DNA_ORIENTATION=-
MILRALHVEKQDISSGTAGLIHQASERGARYGDRFPNGLILPSILRQASDIRILHCTADSRSAWPTGRRNLDAP